MILSLVLILLCLQPGIAEEAVNIYGHQLVPCSSTGMAKTGFTRDGQCGSFRGDSGSHHVCIDLSSVTGGNFCAVTGQPNWCDDDMACQGYDGHLCPVEHWCVCQWAFASYVEAAGGCDKIQEVVCESVNMNAKDAYESSSSPSHQAALACLKEKCGI